METLPEKLQVCGVLRRGRGHHGRLQFFGGLQAAIIVAALGVLETSLSFDNAVVNARVLQHWDHKWRKRFLTWGIFVAVFGMRVIFPLAIVSIASGINPAAVVNMALYAPSDYADHLRAVHHEVAGFGGAFLFMVAFGYFFEEKQSYWWEIIESRLTKLGQIEAIGAGLTLLFAYGLSRIFPNPVHGLQFFTAAVLGVVSFIFAHGLGAILGAGEECDDDDCEVEAPTKTEAPVVSPAGAIIKASIAGFLYLELLDASFSFDGVIGAFVLTDYLPFIALGLGIGAFFVRSMTIHLVEAGTLSEYRYLEAGAFYAIIALAIVMFLSGYGIELPEWATGLMSVVFIGAAFVHSIAANRRDASAESLASYGETRDFIAKEQAQIHSTTNA
jgi:hypothetical protein